jgi:hypothetical protein
MKVFHPPSLTLAAGLLLAGPSFAEVVEIRSISEAALKDPPALVVFDLDNTVYEPAQTMGSDQWGGYQQRRLRDLGVPEPLATDGGVAMFSQAQRATKVRLVELETAAIIRGLQDAGVPVLALTARPLDLVDRTLEQLAGLGVDFTRRPLARGEFTVERTARFRGGVLFVGPHNDKGLLLKAIHKQLRKPLPRSLAFFDDKRHHVDEMEKALADTGTAYTGYRYGAADARVKAFDPAVGDLQWRTFRETGRIPSDEEALKQLKK